MKILLLILAASLVPFAAGAQEGAPRPPRKHPPKERRMPPDDIAAIFSQMDPATRIQLMKEFDKNGDGRLDPKERAEAVESIKEKILDLEQLRLRHAEGVIKKFDKDGDGKLDSKELSAFLEEQRKIFAESRGGRGRGARNLPADILAKYDKDGDGKLGPAERRQMYQDMMSKRNALIKKYDKDGDGKLSDAEKDQLINDPEVRNMMKRMIGNTPPPPPPGDR